MRVVFFGATDAYDGVFSQEVWEALSSAYQASMLETEEQLIYYASGANSLALFLDYEKHKEDSEALARKLIPLGNYKIIYLVSEDKTAAELLRHQKSEVGGDGYLKKPLSEPMICALLTDLDDGVREQPAPSFETVEEVEAVPETPEETPLVIDESKAELEQKFDEVFGDTPSVEVQEEPENENRSGTTVLGASSESEEPIVFDLSPEAPAEEPILESMETAGADSYQDQHEVNSVELASPHEAPVEAIVFDELSSEENIEEEPIESEIPADEPQLEAAEEEVEEVEEDDPLFGSSLDENDEEDVSEEEPLSLEDEEAAESEVAQKFLQPLVEKDDATADIIIPANLFEEQTQENIKPHAASDEEYPEILPQREANRSFDSMFASEGELVKVSSTLKSIKDERSALLSEFDELKKSNELLKRENLSLRADLDEKKIEVSIMRKRKLDEMDEVKHQLRLADEKMALYKEKIIALQKEVEKAEHRGRIDADLVRKRERELENRLELTLGDTASQVEKREQKILELKRKVDTLEFNMQTLVVREQKHKEEKLLLEDRLSELTKALRGSIKILEEDLVLDDELSSKIDKL